MHQEQSPMLFLQIRATAVWSVSVQHFYTGRKFSFYFVSWDLADCLKSHKLYGSTEISLPFPSSVLFLWFLFTFSIIFLGGSCLFWFPGNYFSTSSPSCFPESGYWILKRLSFVVTHHTAIIFPLLSLLNELPFFRFYFWKWSLVPMTF